MTDRTDHYLAAQGALTDAREWGRQAEEPTPEVGELTCLAYAAVHALLAIHDTLTASDRYAANEARQREEAEPDPLDEDDHRDRLDSDGDRWVHTSRGCWHIVPAVCVGDDCHVTLTYISEGYGPLTFAPEAAPDAPRDDLSAPEGESGAEERGEAEDAVEQAGGGHV